MSPLLEHFHYEPALTGQHIKLNSEGNEVQIIVKGQDLNAMLPSTCFTKDMRVMDYVLI